MKFCVSYSTPYVGVDPDALLGYARHAESCGFEGIYLPEHVVGYQGAKVGEFDLAPDLEYVDPLDALAFVAAGTDRLLLGTGVLLLPYHHPVTLAKRLATIDQLSRGRVQLLTVGLGSLPGEATAVGVDFASRGRRADEAIQVLRLLWSGDAAGVSFHGEFFDFDGLASFPRPYRGMLPIHVGGSSSPAARRAGRYGDGYFPGGALLPHVRAAQLELARTTAAEHGRDPQALGYTRTAPIDMTQQRLDAYVEQGVDRVVVSASGRTLDEQRAELSAFADRFL
ncbi:TIGR03619 family F420-dependent LLM class oxidoreductase [Microlunatus soli]|uniref:Probable F420-dependent oxidoreductase, Rv2161c family n=1 Tax=Microlunatus soli TaxID=630515 RepID=A0A1H1QR26_9ACTN|nr:TIGR03619 family F420-dependent LLM class oxidoreductase [Microlunatus soli]SDS25797.1 probable F420-dependent oxidoreductase, Rv2161c family [Microlunatus soli]